MINLYSNIHVSYTDLNFSRRSNIGQENPSTISSTNSSYIPQFAIQLKCYFAVHVIAKPHKFRNCNSFQNNLFSNYTYALEVIGSTFTSNPVRTESTFELNPNPVKHSNRKPDPCLARVGLFFLQTSGNPLTSNTHSRCL